MNAIALILVLMEWPVALITAIFCCTGCCCRPRTGGVVMQPPQQVLYSAAGQPVYVTSSIQTSHSQPMMVPCSQPMVSYGQPMMVSQSQPMVQYSQPATHVSYAGQTAVHASVLGQDEESDTSDSQPLMGATTGTNVTYSDEQKTAPPPAYQLS